MTSIVRFTLLAYGISWIVMIPHMLDTLGIASFGLAARWHGVAALGPLAAAFVMHRSRDPGFRVRDVYRRRGAGGPGRSGTALLASTPLLLLAISLAVTSGGGIPRMGPIRSLTDPTVLREFLVVSVVYGLGEEPGWRGWLLPRLQETQNPLRSTLIVALIWAVWHGPYLAAGIQSGGAGAVVGFCIGLLAAAFWLTFVFNSTGGSVLAAVVWHALWNAATLIARPSPATSMMLGVLLTVSGFGLVLVRGRRGLTTDRRPDEATGRTAGG